MLAARDLSIGLDDMFQYDMLARSLAAGEGFRWYGEEDLALVERYFPLEWVIDEYDPRGILTSFRAPGYPFFLSLVYRISGLENRFFIARLVQALLMAFMAPMAFWLGQRLFPDRLAVGKGAGMVVAAYPYLVIMPLALATEILFLPLVLGTTLAVLRASNSHQPPVGRGALRCNYAHPFRDPGSIAIGAALDLVPGQGQDGCSCCPGLRAGGHRSLVCAEYQTARGIHPDREFNGLQSLSWLSP